MLRQAIGTLPGRVLAAALSVCAFVASVPASAEDLLKLGDVALEPLEWSGLGGWSDDDQAAAFATFLASCKPMLRPRSLSGARLIERSLHAICRRGAAAGSLDRTAARAFFEENFRPISVVKLGSAAGFLTGYYEPIVDGSRTPSSEYTVPMYRRPSDLIPAAQARKAGFANRMRMKSFPNKGPMVRMLNGKPVPYYDRLQIDLGILDGRGLEICWLKDPVDAFFIQIQGSARVRLPDGGFIRLNYDGYNGYQYTPVGRVMIERGLASRDNMSMDRIRQYMTANPDEGRDLRWENKSYVFFRVAELSNDQEAIGGQGIPLTAGRSIAIDTSLHAYGTPFWIDSELPGYGVAVSEKFRRLMIAQDTGSAILGPARADIYFGAGDEAGRRAGRIRHAGRFVMLVPRDIDPLAAWREAPLPPVKAEYEAKAQAEAKAEAERKAKEEAEAKAAAERKAKEEAEAKAKREAEEKAKAEEAAKRSKHVKKRKKRWWRFG